ncbi:MAG: hypothetical protein L0220_30415, partial [Acidobacteria bacterium]|nr:hypothetical protein [Acidobacteriota bacterium]
YVEAARMLAQRMLVEGGSTADDRIAWAFRLATSRWPDEKEKHVLRGNLNAQLEFFRNNPMEAERLLAVGVKRNDAKLDKAELAAYAVTASLILNLDEVITKQ